MLMMDKEGHEKEQPDVKKPKRFSMWLARIFLSVLVLMILIVLIIQFPPVQRWGITKLTNGMQSTLNTKVSIGGFTIHPVSDLTLRNVFIASPEYPTDTLIYADKLHVDYRGIWDLFIRRITINQLGVENGILNIHRFAGDSLNNLDIALLRLLPPKDPTKSDFVLDLKTLNANSLVVRIDDETFGTNFNMSFKRADISFDTINIIGKYLDMTEVDLDEPNIQIVNSLPQADASTAIPGSDKIWSFDIHAMRFTDGKVGLNNQKADPVSYPHAQGIDYAHMQLVDVDIDLDSLVIRGWDFRAREVDIHLLHENGFEINKLAAARAVVSKDSVMIDGLDLETKRSKIKNTLSLLFSGYKDFQSFVDSVKIDIPEADMHVGVSDLMALAPGLSKLDFFMQNHEKDLILQGQVNGYVNRLRIRNMNVGLGELNIRGDMKSHDLAIKGSEFISLSVEKSAFSARSIQSVFPKMNLPPILKRLGQINFVGSFDGYPDNFISFGTFHTSLGQVTLDMNMNILKGIAEGEYSGSIALKNFDLGRFTENPKLGKVSLTGRVIQGYGLDAESAHADITAKLSALEYNGYVYHNARVDGVVTGKLFSGTLDINDPNLDIQFEGSVDARDQLPKLNFVSRIEQLNLFALGLSKKQFEIKGVFETNMLIGKVNQLEGSFLAENVTLTVDEADYRVEHFLLKAKPDSLSGDRVYVIESDPVSGMLSGDFDPFLLPLQMHHYLSQKYPTLIDPPQKTMETDVAQRLNWNLVIADSEHWFDLLGAKGLNLKRTALTGGINLQNASIFGTIHLPELHYHKVSTYETNLSFDESNGVSKMNLDLIAADINENFFFEEVSINGGVSNDSIRLNFKTDELAGVINKLNFDLKAKPKKGNWEISFLPIQLVMLGDDWKVPAGNKLEIRKDEFEITNFQLVSGDKKILLNDVYNKGIEAYVSGFDITYLNEIWLQDKFSFSGLYTLDFELDNLFEPKRMNAVLSLPALRINDIPYGRMVITTEMNDPKDSVAIDIALINKDATLFGVGAFLPPLKVIPVNDQNFLRLDLKATEFPLDFLEFLIGENIRDTEGSVDMTLNLRGKINALNPEGEGTIYNGSTTIDYLGVGYSFHKQKFKITETRIDLSGITLYDVLGNTAVVQGGLTHRYLRNLGLDATLKADKILGLDVTSDENNIFYGKGIGSVNASFSGTVANPKMVIDMTTAKGTHIYIPLSSGTTSTDQDFAIFLENGMLPVTPPTKIDIGGIDLTMNMTITDDAMIDLIFDDNTGEVLRGTGTGSIDMSMDRLGNLSMYGDYVISSGDYLFTNFIVRKPFLLNPGGVIQWNGDPYDANLAVQAKYKDLSASVYPLIQEYITDPTGAQSNVYSESKNRTRVDLLMTLTGSLLQPDISFDIQFPDLSGELKGYVNTKVNILKANENAMLQQVVGLLITRSFLPDITGAGGTSLITQGINNTFSELISSTISGYLGSLLGDLIPTGQVLSGISLEMNLGLPITSGGTGDVPTNLQDDPNATVVEVDLPLEFFNDRLEVRLGGDFVTGATTVSETDYLAGDVTFSYKITPDGKLKIRAYNQNAQTIEGRRNKTGVGLTYRREYNTFDEFLGKKKKNKQ